MLDRIQELPPIEESEIGCTCLWCQRKREHVVQYLRRKRGSIGVTHTYAHAVENFIPNSTRYEWDRTSLEDYGLTARHRLIQNGIFEDNVRDFMTENNS